MITVIILSIQKMKLKEIICIVVKRKAKTELQIQSSKIIRQELHLNHGKKKINTVIFIY